MLSAWLIIHSESCNNCERKLCFPTATMLRQTLRLSLHNRQQSPLQEVIEVSRSWDKVDHVSSLCVRKVRLVGTRRMVSFSNPFSGGDKNQAYSERRLLGYSMEQMYKVSCCIECTAFKGQTLHWYIYAYQLVVRAQACPFLSES